MVGHRIRRSGRGTTCGAGASSRDVPQSFIKGKCVQGEGTSTTRGPTQPALFATQWRACTPDEGLHFHGWQQEWVWLLRGMGITPGSSPLTLNPSFHIGASSPAISVLSLSPFPCLLS